MSKYDTVINSTNTVGVSCGIWSVVYSWVQSIDWVAVGSALGMAVAYLLNIYFNIQKRKDEREKVEKEVAILKEKAEKEVAIIKENNDRKLSIELAILKEQLAEEKRKNMQAEKDRERHNNELLNIAFKDKV